MQQRMLYTALGAFLCISLSASATLAQVPKRTVNPDALALFNQARALMDQGKYAEACPKLEKAHALENGIGITFNLADCHEHIGRTASAWIGFQDVAAAADAAGQPERAQAARARVTALLPKLSRLRIVVPEEAAAIPSLDIQRNGISVGKLVWGSAVPVDPDKYIVSAMAPARSPWSTTVTVSKAGDVVEVTVPALESAQRQDSSAGVEMGSTATAPLNPAWFIATGALAAVGLGLGIGMTVAASGKSSHADELLAGLPKPSPCLNPVNGGVQQTCDEILDSLKAQGTFSNVAVGGFVVGGLFALGTAGLFVYSKLKPSASDEAGAPPAAASVHLVPVFDATHGGAVLVGTW